MVSVGDFLALSIVYNEQQVNIKNSDVLIAGYLNNKLNVNTDAYEDHKCIIFLIKQYFFSDSIGHYLGIKTCTISDEATCIEGMEELLSYNPKYVGFDCEWKCQKGRAVSLIQIAHRNIILLIRIHLFWDIPYMLLSFLSNQNILKCGVGIDGDRRKLKKDYNVNLYGCIDLNYVNKIHSAYLSLEKLSNIILNQPMRFKHCVNHYQWENKKLNRIQICYASDDAMIAYLLLEKILRRQYANDYEFFLHSISTNNINSNNYNIIQTQQKQATQFNCYSFSANAQQQPQLQQQWNLNQGYVQNNINMNMMYAQYNINTALNMTYFPQISQYTLMQQPIINSNILYPNYQQCPVNQYEIYNAYPTYQSTSSLPLPLNQQTQYL